MLVPDTKKAAFKRLSFASYGAKAGLAHLT